MTRPHLLRAARRATRRNLAAAALAVAGLLATAVPARAATPVSPDGAPQSGRGCSRATAPALDTAVRQTMRQAGIPGVIVGVWQPGMCDYVRAFGKADLTTGAPMRPDLNMRIGSETKTFTATALLELVDEHRVGLDDPISRYVSGVPHGDSITLRQLGEMRSGLFPYSADSDFLKAYLTNPRVYFTPQQLLAYAFKHANLFAPGTQYQYSNTNYILLGLVIEKITHRPLGVVLRDRVFGPSQLCHTLFANGAELPVPHAHGYTEQTLDGKLADSTDWNTSWVWAAGSIVSDLRDLRRWAPEVATGALLSPATQAERTKFLPTGIPGVGYGIGLFDADGWIGHDGLVPGYESLTLYLPEQHATLVILVNTDVADQGDAPTSSFAKAITTIVSPDHVFSIPPVQ